MTCAEGLGGLSLAGPAGCMKALFFILKATGIHISRGNMSGLMPQGEWTGEEVVGAAGPVRRLLQGSGWGWVGLNWQVMVEVLRWHQFWKGGRMHAGGRERACEERLWY